MEYPTFITAGTLTAFNSWPLDRVYLPEVVVAHEFAHQYFQGLVASNEVEEAWLDEGITEWATGWLVDELIGADRSLLEVAGLRVGDLDYQRLGNHRGRGLEMIRQPSWTYDTGYVFNAYGRPSLTLRTLEGLLGRRTMARVMRTYAERWRFGHPSSDDFYRVASEVAGRDLMPFFRQTIESPAVVDYAVGEITQDAAYTAVTVRRAGDLQMPVVVAFKFAGRPVERRNWDGVGRWTRFTFGYAEPLEWVDVDPDRKIALDVSWLNNGRVVASDRRAPAAMTSRWLLAVQQVLSWLAFYWRRRMSGVGAMRAGWARLWTRAAFAVVATWAIVTIVAVVVVAPAWAWWSAALGHTIDGARLLGSPNLATLVEVFRESPFAARTIAVAAIAGAALALLLNPFLAGGVIGALVREPLVRRARGRRRRPGRPLRRGRRVVLRAAAARRADPLADRRDRDWRQRGRRREPARAPRRCWPWRPAPWSSRAGRWRRRCSSIWRGSTSCVRTSAVPAAPCWARFASSAARRPACSCCGWRSARPLALAGDGAAGGARLAVGRDLAGDPRRRRRPAGARVRPHLAARDAGRERGGAGGSGCGRARRPQRRLRPRQSRRSRNGRRCS